jgi:hypothetical protein
MFTASGGNIRNEGMKVTRRMYMVSKKVNTEMFGNLEVDIMIREIKDAKEKMVMPRRYVEFVKTYGTPRSQLSGFGFWRWWFLAAL